MIELSLILPCYNEENNILPALVEVQKALSSCSCRYEIIVVNDGSTDGTAQVLERVRGDQVRVISHETNLGYGAAVKSGLCESRHEWAGIIDVDFTYPFAELASLIPCAGEYDMVVGSRTAKVRKIPLVRRPAKWFINRLASYIVRQKIPDVNSGMRIFRKDIAMDHFHLFPDGFSFTTTLTLVMLKNRKKVKYIPINYLKRKGRSKIKPFGDFYQFVLLIMRVAMLFDPLRVFLPIFTFSAVLTLASIVRDIYLLNMTDTTVILFFFSLLVLMIGLLADLINRKIPWQK